MTAKLVGCVLGAACLLTGLFWQATEATSLLLTVVSRLLGWLLAVVVGGLVLRLVWVWLLRRALLPLLDRASLEAVDAALFYLDPQLNSTIISGFLIFDRCLDSAALQARLREQLRVRLIGASERFQRRVERSWLLGYPRLRRLRRDDNPALSQAAFMRHWHAHTDHIAGKPELLAELSRAVAAPLQLGSVDAPPWEWHFFERISLDDGERSGLLFRLHHVLGDGMSILRLVLNATDWDRQSSINQSIINQSINQSSINQSSINQSSINQSSINQSSINQSSTSQSLTRQSSSQSLTRQSSINQSTSQSKLSMTTSDALKTHVRSLSELLFRPADGTFFAQFRAADGQRADVLKSTALGWFDLPLSVEQLKAASRRAGARSSRVYSINHVLLAGLAGAMRSWTSSPPTVIMWVSLSPPSRMLLAPDDPRHPMRHGLSNRELSFVYVTLPLHLDSPAQRLDDVHAQTERLLASLAAPASNLCTAVVGCLPEPLAARLLRIVGQRASVSCSNVPGPQFPVSLAGATVDRLCFFLPPQPEVSLMVTIMSYNGTVTVCYGGNRALMNPDAQQAFRLAFTNEINTLASL